MGGPCWGHSAKVEIKGRSLGTSPVGGGGCLEDGFLRQICPVQVWGECGAPGVSRGRLAERECVGKKVLSPVPDVQRSGGGVQM